METYRHFAQDIAQEAGLLLKAHLGQIRSFRHKGVVDLVTEMDIRSEALITAKIRHRFPRHGILAEENTCLPKASAYRWIIDPLDGTTNYAHGLPIYCVSIALEKDGKIVLGVVYDPSRDELFWAQRGLGAFLGRKRIRVSKTAVLSQSLLATGFPYDLRENPMNNLDHFAHFALRTHAVRRLGSAALDLCYVAAGRFDGYWEMKIGPWDFAAGGLIVQEAGGKLTDFQGRSIQADGKNILATNGQIHGEMIQVLGLGKSFDGKKNPSNRKAAFRKGGKKG